MIRLTFVFGRPRRLGTRTEQLPFDNSFRKDGIDTDIEVGVLERLQADEHIFPKQFAVEISLGAFHAVEAEKYLDVFVADEQVFRDGAFDRLQKRVLAVGENLDTGRTIGGFDFHRDFEIGSDFHDRTPRKSEMVGKFDIAFQATGVILIPNHKVCK